ncbi:Uncharacterized protein QTN25_009360 [Entamoeba marina]
MENIDKLASKFVTTPETEQFCCSILCYSLFRLVYNSYLNCCSDGTRSKIVAELKNDLMKMQVEGKITSEKMNEIVNKHVNDLPPEMMESLASEIATFIQSY